MGEWLLKWFDKKYFTKSYQKKTYTIYKNTIEHYKKWDNEKLILEKIDMETRLSSEHSFYHYFIIGILITFLASFFSSAYQFGSNFFKIAIQAKYLIPSEEKQKKVDYLLQLIQDNLNLFDTITKIQCTAFLLVIILLGITLILHIENRMWYQKNLSVIKYILEKRINQSNNLNDEKNNTNIS